MAQSTINKLVGFLKQNMDKLYKNTYYSQSNNMQNLDQLKVNIDKSLDKISSNNKELGGYSSISKLYNRIHSSEKDPTIQKQLDDIFGNKAYADGMVMSTYNENKYIKEMDDEKDLLCKYMPKLEDAIDAKQDNVLSSDHYSKDYINAKNITTSDTDTFNTEITKLKKKYSLIETCNKLYKNTSKYGEQYLYIVPYSEALQKLLQNKQQSSTFGFIGNEATVLKEAFINNTDEIKIPFKQKNIKELLNESSSFNLPNQSDYDKYIEKYKGLEVKFNRSGILESAFNEISSLKSLKTKQETIPQDKLKYKELDGQEYIIDPTNKIDEDINKIDVPGCVMKVIPRYNIIPLYIENICLGYYCIETTTDDIFNMQKSGAIDPMMGLRNGTLKFTNTDKEKKDILLRYLSKELAQNIDSKFINANQDLSKEIYAVLKSNDLLNGKNLDRIKVTYIPPEHIIHWYWEKDENTNRGISDLEKGLIPAKLYTSLYMTNLSGYLTRGFDKRVYYVKQSVEKNISRTLLHTINQIKMGNFGSREMTNIKHMLNITGKFNDLIIPVGSTNEPPVQFDIMPGQQIDVKSEMMDMLEEMAVSSTGVPYEYIQSRQTVDYAVRLTMSSNKFLKSTYTRQATVQELLSRMLTILYNSEYKKSDEIVVELPPPIYLSMINTSTMIQNSTEITNFVVESEAKNDDPEYIKLFTRNYRRYQMSTYLDYDKIEEINQKTLMEWKTNKNKEE